MLGTPGSVPSERGAGINVVRVSLVQMILETTLARLLTVLRTAEVQPLRSLLSVSHNSTWGGRGEVAVVMNNFQGPPKYVLKLFNSYFRVSLTRFKDPQKFSIIFLKSDNVTSSAVDKVHFFLPPQELGYMSKREMTASHSVPSRTTA